MLVTFKCKVCGDILMFGDVAKQLLRMMGHCENIPGVIEHPEIDDALLKLIESTQKIHQQELDAIKQSADDVDQIDDLNELDIEPVVSLYNRALPLIKMLESARDADCFVTWESNEV